MKIFQLFIAALCFLFFCCTKQNDWLNVKRLSLDVTPVTMDDFQALLDNGYTLNMKFPAAGLLGTDNIVLSDVNFLSVSETEQNLYTFASDIWKDGESDDWNNAFTIIEYANIVLEGLTQLKGNTDATVLQNIKGQALFMRSFAFFSLSQLFCKPYIQSTANADLGLPLRLSANVNKVYPRSSLADTYQQMLQDAHDACELLLQDQITNFRPNKSAAFGLLAKINLAIGHYEQAAEAVENALHHKDELMDFNNADMVDSTATYPFPSVGIGNPEVLFNASNNNYRSLGAGLLKKEFIDPHLFSMYENSDLRKKFFFRIVDGNIIYNGSYSGGLPIFCGIATNELFLIKAECNARLGNVQEALIPLNTLLRNRYKTGSFSEYSDDNADSVLKLILNERRKELPSTGNVRWEDLRRLNIDQRFQISVRHTINGTDYILPPNDAKYILPIPTNEIEISNIEQNPR